MLATSGPAGNPVALAPQVLASLAQARRRPDGFASYAARRQGGRQTHGVEGTSTTLSGRVRTRCRGRLTGPRPSHTPKA